MIRLSPLALLLSAFLLSVLSAGRATAADLPTQNDPRVVAVYTSPRVWNGIAITNDGRTFACFPRADGPGPGLQELKPDSTATPWPDTAWNAWKPGSDFTSSFVLVNSIRIGPDGKLWVVDGGAQGIGKPALPGAARLFCFDVATGHLDRTFSFKAVTKAKSFIDDVRFDGEFAYLTDAGAPGLVVIELKTGKMRRVLDGVPAATDLRAMKADGKVLLDEKGREVRVHADQIEVSPDGTYVYFQPASGPLARIESKYLNDSALSADALAGHVEADWVDTPTSGGTAIDANGNIYMGDANERSILKIAPDKTVTTLASDARFIWTDAMWIDRDGNLWIPAAQLNRTKGMDDGKKEVSYPVTMYKIAIGAKPPAIDHP